MPKDTSSKTGGGKTVTKANSKTGAAPKANSTTANGRGRPRKNAVAPAQPQPDPAIEAQLRDAQNQVLELLAQLAIANEKLKGPTAITPSIIPIAKPKGSPGRRGARGYSIQEKMLLGDTSDPANADLYRDFQRAVRDSCVFFSINRQVTYRQQDSEIKSKICRRVEKLVPYACKERFPNHWCTRAYLQLHLHHHRFGSSRSSSDDDDASNSPPPPGPSPSPSPSPGPAPVKSSGKKKAKAITTDDLLSEDEDPMDFEPEGLAAGGSDDGGSGDEEEDD